MSNTRVVLVTGGMGGLGETISTKMADAGYKVAVTYSPGNTKHAEWVAGMKGRGYDIAAVPCDVADLDSCAKAVAEVTAKVGPVDVLVNNAGITQDARLVKMTLEQFDRVIDVNLRGVFHCAQAVADTMIAQGQGVILNASSVVGIYGNFGQTNYAATKFGVIGFTKTWAREMGGKGVRINAVAPGFIATDMTAALGDEQQKALTGQIPLGRLGAPADIAAAVAYLASPEAGYVTGQELHVNGGMFMA